MSASEKLRALDEAMTPGPWREVGRYIEALKEKRVAELPMGGVLHAKVDMRNTQNIAALRNALPQLVAVVEAAERVAFDTARTSVREGERLCTEALAALDAALGKEQDDE